MELSQQSSRITPTFNIHHILRKLRFSDYKTDIFLAANVMDAVFTYIALQEGAQLTEFNSIIYGVMDTIGTGTALFLKVVLCILITWVLRKTKKENLLIPLSITIFLVALINLVVIRAYGIEV